MDRSRDRRPPGSTPRLGRLTALFEKLIGEEDEQQAVGLIRQILDQEDALSYCVDVLERGSSEERWWAVRVLAEVENRAARLWLRSSLSDPDPTVRQCATVAIRDQPDPKAIPDLVALLQGDDRLQARLAGDALVKLGGQALPPLLEVLEKGRQSARVEAIRALALMDDPGAVTALFRGLDDESALIEHWADEGLQRRGIGMIFYR